MVLNGALWKKVSIARGKEAVVLMESGRKRLSSDGRKKDAVTWRDCPETTGSPRSELVRHRASTTST